MSKTNKNLFQKYFKDDHKLKGWNATAALFHTVVLIVFIVWSGSRRENQTISDEDTYYNTALLQDSFSFKNNEVIQGYETTGVSLNVATLIALFLVITILAHLYYAFSSKYLEKIKQKVNPFRWIEYGLSASIMVVLIYILSTGRNASVILLLFAAIAAVMAQGYIMERHIESKFTVYTSWIVGWGLMAVAWVPIFINVFKAFDQQNEIREGLDQQNEIRKGLRVSPTNDENTSNELPVEVLAILLVVIILFYISFGVINVVHYRNYLRYGKNYSFVKIEKAYITASFVSKTFLVVYVASAVLASPLTWLKFTASEDI